MATQNFGQSPQVTADGEKEKKQDGDLPTLAASIVTPPQHQFMMGPPQQFGAGTMMPIVNGSVQGMGPPMHHYGQFSAMQFQPAPLQRQNAMPHGGPGPSQQVANRQGYSFSLGDDRYVHVKLFRGRVYVTIRVYMYDSNESQYKVTRSGINLNVDQWQILVDHFGQIQNAIAEMKKPMIAGMPWKTD